MLFGIGLIGMLTGTITTYFTNKGNSKEPVQKNDCDALLEVAQTLSKKQIEELTAIAKAIKNIR